MKVESIRIFSGANIYKHNPVVLIRLDLGDLKSKESREIGDFNEKLLRLLPGLKEHPCITGEDGEFLRRLRSGTHFNHVLEHVLLELMFLAGGKSGQSDKCGGDEKNDSKAIVETTKVETTRYLVPIGVELIDSIVQEKSIVFEQKLNETKEIYADNELGPSTKAIIKAAERRNIPWSRENEFSLVQLGYGKNLRLVQAALTDNTSLIAVDMAGNKDATKQRLAKFSIPVPEGEIVRTEDEAVTAFESIGAPVVVKPLDGRQGRGVSLNLTTAEEVREAFRQAEEYSSRVLVEELFTGQNYRVLVVGGKMVAASERMPCYVIGDGTHTVGELIEIENQNPLRGEGHEKPLTKIKINQILLAALEKEGWKIEDVPSEGEQVMLCAGINLSTGGTARDVTDKVHPSVKAMCERAARIINLDICGVDVVLDDISRPVRGQKGGIIELNAAPGLRMHCYPSEGKPRDVGEAIVEMLYPHGKNFRIPIISITGTNGKTTVTRMISHMLFKSGLNVGTTTTDGIFLNEQEIVRGDTTGPVSARTILGDRSVEVAVLETARGGIARRGLGYDWSDISVMTNISEDHIGQDDIHSVDDLINIKALLAERVRPGGTLIINADDENCLRVLEREKVKSPPKNIVYFSLAADNPVIQKHISTGGLAYFPQNGQIIESHGGIFHPLINIDDIPLTMNGLAEFQVANALSAVAACRVYGLAVQDIAGLKSFDNAVHNPGRNNLYQVGRGYVLIDYGHNPGAFEAVCKMAAKWSGRRVTGIIGVPGDRDDELIRRAARIAARGFHRIIIKEDVDLRGRSTGEVAGILCETVTREAPGRRCDIALDEVRAFSDLVAEIGEDEVIVLFYDKLEPILDVLARYGATPAVLIQESAVQTPELAISGF